MRRGIANKFTIGFLTMSTNFKPNKINLKSVTLSQFDTEWHMNAPVDTLFMATPLHEFMAELMNKEFAKKPTSEISHGM